MITIQIKIAGSTIMTTTQDIHIDLPPIAPVVAMATVAPFVTTAKITATWQVIDADGTGTLNVTELVQGLLKIRRELTKRLLALKQVAVPNPFHGRRKTETSDAPPGGSCLKGFRWVWGSGLDSSFDGVCVCVCVSSLHRRPNIRSCFKKTCGLAAR